MDTLCMSKDHKESEDVESKKCTNCGNGHNKNSLLCAFIEYVWSEGEEKYSECKATGLMTWLASEDLDVNKKLWHTSNKLDARIIPKIVLTDYIELNDNFLRIIQDLYNERMYATIAYDLRKILSILIACNEDVKYANAEGQTFIHIFIEEYLKNTETLTQDQIVRVKKLIGHLVARNAPFFANDKHGQTPIHVATTCKDQEVLKIILSSLDDVNERDTFGNTMLHIVVDMCVDEEINHKNDYSDLVQDLILKGANPNAKNEEGVSPIHMAAEKFHVDILQIFCENAGDFDQRTNDTQTPLHFACKSQLQFEDSTKVIQTFDFLVRKSVNLEAVDGNGFTPLHFAAECQSIEIVERLVALGVDVDSRTQPLLLTPLYLAAKSDKLENMKELVNAGVDVNADGLDGSTPLFMSVMLGSYESMQFLMDQGADIHRRENVAGFTLLHMAACDANKKKLNAFADAGFHVDDPGMCGITPLQLAVLHLNFDQVKMLIEHGADVNYQRDVSDLSALHLAIIVSSFEIVEILVENGVDVNRRGGVEQMTPLHMALAGQIQWNLGKCPADLKPYKDVSYVKKYWPGGNTSSGLAHERLVPLLLQNGAMVNAKDLTGKTPLHLAALHCKADVMKLLVESGAQVNVQDMQGKLPLHNTFIKGDCDGLKCLLDFGADINDNDVSDLVMMSKVKLKNIVIQQAIKLKLAGLPIAKVYESLVSSTEFKDFYDKCSAAAMNLMNYREDSSFSFYKLLQMNVKLQYQYNGKISSSYENLEQLLPMYASVIRSACRESANRKPLLELARTAWIRVTKLSLPEVCVEHILNHLNNRYLEVFSENAYEIDKIFIDKDIKPAFTGTSAYII